MGLVCDGMAANSTPSLAGLDAGGVMVDSWLRRNVFMAAMVGSDLPPSRPDSVGVNAVRRENRLELR